MIDPHALPKISEILHHLGMEPRRNRSKCPIHGGDNPQSLSFNDDAGHWFCHRCGIGGDAVELVRRSLDTDFRGALRFFGLEPGRPPAPDPERVRRQQIRAGLRRWADDLGRRLRLEHYVMERVIATATRRLTRDPEDEWGWSWLQWAYRGQERIVHELDMIDGSETQQICAYRLWRQAA